MAEKIDLFQIVNHLCEKGPIFSEEDIALNYKPYIINRTLSNHKDLIFLAEEMNKNWQLSPLQQYHFYYYAIDKKKRYAKWPKRETDLDEKINLLKEYYGYSTLRARETVSIIDHLELWDEIKLSLEKGGTGKSGKIKSKNIHK